MNHYRDKCSFRLEFLALNQQIPTFSAHHVEDVAFAFYVSSVWAVRESNALTLCVCQAARIIFGAFIGLPPLIQVDSRDAREALSIMNKIFEAF